MSDYGFFPPPCRRGTQEHVRSSPGRMAQGFRMKPHAITVDTYSHLLPAAQIAAAAPAQRVVRERQADGELTPMRTAPATRANRSRTPTMPAVTPTSIQTLV